MIRFMNTQKNTASTDRQNGGRTMYMTDFIIAKNTSGFSKKETEMYMLIYIL